MSLPFFSLVCVSLSCFCGIYLGGMGIRDDLLTFGAPLLSKCFLPSPASQSSQRVMGKQQTYIALIPTSPRIDCMSVWFNVLCYFSLQRDGLSVPKAFGKYSDEAECVVHDLVPNFDIWIFESGFMTLHQTSPTPLPPHNVCVTFLLPLTQPQPPLICLPKMYLELNMALDGDFGCLKIGPVIWKRWYYEKRSSTLI